ncbi:ERF family protein [Alkalihalobacillus trypoxylicola]|uniref:Single-stranded DNA-binding protein n=1 Tax=Alkalihalobacillus trypoxylicola TaxID=519424 RepID=A0A162D566_9BACI|nr:ERF family protein [Alkalihalobacillus trypoxylicola]KYG28139.1 hypothetical protein AZF04_09555 [Alkalihalobacillus trypoxylicola]
MIEERKLVKKLARVMKEVKSIPKNGFNKFHKYNYVLESDVAEKVREILADENIMMIPNMTYQSVREHKNHKGNIEYIATVVMEFTFYDGDTGEEICFQVPGEGQDAGDKAIYKAITGAQKYAMMKAFMIPTGDDPETDTGTDERNNGYSKGNSTPASDNQLDLVKKLTEEVAKKTKITVEEAYATLKKRLNTNNEMANFTKDEASKAINYLNGVKKGA